MARADFLRNVELVGQQIDASAQQAALRQNAVAVARIQCGDPQVE